MSGKNIAESKNNIPNLLREEIQLLKTQNDILSRNTYFTGASTIIAMLAFAIAIIALLR